MSKFQSQKKGLLLIIIADLFWGTVFVASQIGLQYMNPYVLVLLRFFIATLIISSILPLVGRSHAVLDELRRKWTWIFGLIYMFGFLFQYLGQDLTTASEATLLANLAPIIVPFFALIFLKEVITTPQILAMGLGLIGLLLISSPELSLNPIKLIGDLLLFGTSVAYALFTSLSKMKNISSIGSSFAVIITTTLFLAPIAVFLGGLFQTELSPELAGWVAIVYLGIPCTLVAITIYLKGLGVVPASKAAIFFLIQVIVGLILSAVLFEDLLNDLQLIGAVLIVTALGFGSRTKNESNRL